MIRTALILAFAAAIAASDGPGPPPPGMAWVPGGTFIMGDDAGPDDERPAHAVALAGFWMDRTLVTNAEFARFIAATAYVTTAERAPDPKLVPDAGASAIAPGAGVFTAPPANADPHTTTNLWRWVAGACWRAPEGPGSTIDGRDSYPVVQVSWMDASAYAGWAGKRLPTEAEFEFAMRGGRHSRYAWGDELRPEGRWMANIWQGDFPRHDEGEDGFRGLSPVASFPANAYGLFDIAGNAWEWTEDWYRSDAYLHPNAEPRPAEGEPRKVLRGGSFLCAAGCCNGFLPTTRMAATPDTGLNHTGFRCVRSP